MFLKAFVRMKRYFKRNFQIKIDIITKSILRRVGKKALLSSSILTREFSRSVTSFFSQLFTRKLNSSVKLKMLEKVPIQDKLLFYNDTITLKLLT